MSSATPDINLEGLRPWGGLAGASLEQAAVAVVGIAYDGSAVYRKGAAEAPARIRQLSALMPPVTEAGDSLLGLAVADLGDLDPGLEIEAGWQPVADRLAGLPKGLFLTVFGGDHCSAIAVLAAQKRRHRDLHVVWIDAHPDLCDFSRGGAWTCGCALRRSLEVAALPPERVSFVGSRDYDPEEVDFIRAHGLREQRAVDVVADPRARGRELGDRLVGRPVHVSFDIDALDPAFAPGTEVPSAGGLSTRDALAFLAELAPRVRLVGFDVMEVAPALDHNDVTSLAALKLTFEIWGHAWKARM